VEAPVDDILRYWSNFEMVRLSARRVKLGRLYTLTGRRNLVSIAIVSLLVLVIVVVIAIPIMIRVFGEAARRNPNEEEDETSERDPNHDS
jgi:hypothetical protein